MTCEDPPLLGGPAGLWLLDAPCLLVGVIYRVLTIAELRRHPPGNAACCPAAARGFP